MKNNEYEVHDPRFRLLLQPNASMDKLTGECLWAEGPVYFPATDLLIWSDIPNNRMLRWAPGMGVGVYRAPSNYSNGNTRDREGRLVSCEHGERRVTRTEHDGSITVIASHFEGKRLNSPNDVIVDSEGAIWFTDPDYGIISDYEGYRSDSEIGRCNVYRVSPGDTQVRLVSDDFVKPNGLAFSPDESKLYIADSAASHDDNAPRHICVFDVASNGALRNGRVFVEMQSGVPDGMRVDEHGNVWTSAEDGVHCYAPDGALLGKILIPEVVANLTFGGPRRNRLFITATSSVYALHVGVRGAAR
ncbi:MAG: Gluconolactonase (EC [uncultured Paraburkholderia sp.]|uniref:SMP-30/gluconolactonase/LRE family protein n=1 Tax=uncultured Paraburkholderia sp. TaxID=1822466 RepID=UPI00259A02A8|nr:SMP-30/gluconolactonase/LRE family protein [uncultured Paraburkholderia sp.]CAH2894807.1 MAG: Gluconolactonase (EC [uncultured Paraburkholderia sp.]CAH2913425.1 MAG: Gluconolactonase (EC [uncultured Paraburkholderia sp.]